MITIEHYNNPSNDRLYTLEYGSDLFNEYYVRVRYGINLGISKNYLFSDNSTFTNKIAEIKNKRFSNGYVKK